MQIRWGQEACPGHGGCSEAGMRPILLVLLLGAVAPAAASDVPLRSGGIGAEERAALEGVSHNLKVVTAMQGGAYLADVGVRLHDARNSIVVDTQMAGPWLLATVPPGRYRLVAEHAGVRQVRDVVVPAEGRAELVLRWNVLGEGVPPAR
jgi:hypothetical protein